MFDNPFARLKDAIGENFASSDCPTFTRSVIIYSSEVIDVLRRTYYKVTVKLEVCPWSLHATRWQSRVWNRYGICTIYHSLLKYWHKTQEMYLCMHNCIQLQNYACNAVNVEWSYRGRCMLTLKVHFVVIIRNLWRWTLLYSCVYCRVTCWSAKCCKR